MAPTRPSPQTFTLKLKHHKTTILLHADPNSTLTSLKEELLRALKETCPNNSLNDKPLPDSPLAIVLAIPKDVTNPGAGWSRVGSLPFRPVSSKASEETIKGIGLREGGCLAFKWSADGEESDLEQNKRKKEDEDEAMVMDGIEDLEEEEDWDVIIPSYEDIYGVDNAVDVGARAEGETGNVIEE
jgi:hypothetical protein